MEPLPKILKPPARYSMTKYLRHLKGLMKTDPSAVPLPSKLQSTIEFYKSQGLIINKLVPSQFHLKNGLPYEGFLTPEKLAPHETLLQIPRHLFLGTRDAYLTPELIKVMQENRKAFWAYDSIDEDLVLITFLLYEYGKGEKSSFYHIISSLPQDQDILVMWPLGDLELFEDYELKRSVEWRRDEITKSFEAWREALLKYPDIFDPKTVTFENFSWLYCLLLNRCFGTTNFEYVQMIPVAEMLNHDCTRTHYKLIKKEAQPEAEKVENVILAQNEEEALNAESTDQSSEDQQSDYEEDYYEEGVLEDCGLDSEVEWNREFIHFLKNTLDFNDIGSLLFAYKVLEFVKEQTLAKRPVDFQDLERKTLEFIKNRESLLMGFLHAKSYKEWAESHKFYDIDKDIGPEPPEDLFLKEFPEKKTIEKVIFRTGPKEFYEENSQVFFSYGWKSNQALIQNYGMCIEYNCFGHVYLKLECREYQGFDERILKELVEKDVRLLKYKRFKMKYTKFNLEIPSFFKLFYFDFSKHSIESLFKPLDWDLEMMVADEILDFFESGYKSKYSLQENESMLFDQNLGYHAYFAAIYRAEKQRILEFQKKIFRVYKEIARRRKAGETAEESVRRVEGLENEEEALRHRYVLYPYLKMM